MHFSTIFAATALAGAAFAEDHTIAVSNKMGDLVFKPDSLKAAEGDTVTFKFWPKNHSIAQSTFAAPCEPMNNGFWSGFVPTMDMESVANTTFTYEITNASQPIWYYCSQGKHCQGGMVGVINAPASGPNTIAAFKRAAAQASDNVSPTTTAGTGGNITNGTSTSESESSPSADATGAASQMAGSAVFAGLTGLFTYFLI